MFRPPTTGARMLPFIHTALLYLDFLEFFRNLEFLYFILYIPN